MPTGIAKSRGRRARRHVEADFEAFRIGARRHHVADALHQRLDLEIALVEHEAVGFEPRQVENIVDHRQQVVGGITDISA